VRWVVASSRSDHADDATSAGRRRSDACRLAGRLVLAAVTSDVSVRPNGPLAIRGPDRQSWGLPTVRLVSASVHAGVQAGGALARSLPRPAFVPGRSG